MQDSPSVPLRSTFDPDSPSHDTFAKVGSDGSSSGSDDSFQRREDEACKATSFPGCDVTALTLSLGSSSRWWEEAAEEVFRDSLDFELVIRTVKFIPLLDSTTATILLSKRHKNWLEDFVKFLFRGEDVKEHCHSSSSCTAEAIVAIIRGVPSSLSPRWNGDWFLNLLSSNVHDTAEKLDCDIKSAICRISFPQWTAWFCGYQCVMISDLFDDLFNFRNTLAQHAKRDKEVWKNLVLLEKALPTQQPLPQWIVSTAILFDVSSNASDTLVSFFKPIVEQFEEPSGQLEERYPRISLVGQKLAILDAHFKSRLVLQPDPEWPAILSADFSLWERIHKESPQALAELITSCMEGLFSKVSSYSLLVGDGYMADISRKSSHFKDELSAYLIADNNLASYILELAEHFLYQHNISSAAAIGMALVQSGYQPQPSRVWDTINPKDNFSGCTKYADESPGCLPHISSYIMELRRSKTKRADKVVAILTMIAKQVARTGEAEVERIESNFLPYYVMQPTDVGSQDDITLVDTGFAQQNFNTAEVDDANNEEINEDSGTNSDTDSALALDRRDSMNSTITMTSEHRKPVEKHNRTYHSYHEGKYLLPNDEEEQDRLDLQHKLFSLTLDGKLHLAPLPKTDRVLDMGTGTGIWAMDFADEHSDVHVCGVDLSPIQPSWTPPNCIFEIDDISLPWTFKKFGFIHGRMLFCSFSDPIQVFRQAFETLEARGVLEMQDVIFDFRSDDASLHGTALEELTMKLKVAFGSKGIDLTCASRYRNFMETVGLESIQQTDFCWPVGTWPQDKYLKKLGM